MSPHYSALLARFFLIFVLILAWCLGMEWCGSNAKASGVDKRLVLAQCLIAEAGTKVKDDHRAILWVLRARAQLPRCNGRCDAADVALRYCALFRAVEPSPRQAHIRALTWEGAGRLSPGVVELVRSWSAGERVDDPCGGRAILWGGPMDAHPGHWFEVITCGSGTANVFYARATRVLPARVASGQQGP